MTTDDTFQQTMVEGYASKGDAIVLGAAMHLGQCNRELFVRLPLKTFNRHGLIAGATGTGKTKTLQVLAEQLSQQGIPSLVMDIKGDLSGLAVAAQPNPAVLKRHEAIGLPYAPGTSPVEFLALSAEPGARLRATVSEFGPVLFSRMLGLNDVQQSIVTVVFKYCDDQGLPLLDLKDFKTVLHYIQAETKDAFEKAYGAFPSASVGTIVRAIVELEQQGAEAFFGEPSFDVQEHLQLKQEGKGVISIVRLADIQNQPKLYSTFMLQLLAEIYQQFPEAGDLDKPRLVMFIDEAHLLFDQASGALLEQIEMIIKLIRSKGVGVFFVTQNPTDIPDAILGQLGLKVQHALRAFTAKDRKSIKLVAENYPQSQYYEVDKLITELGIGEALVTALNDKGVPTPLVHCYLRAPQSRMDVLTTQELHTLVGQSALVKHYNAPLDRESAYEKLSHKLGVNKSSASEPPAKAQPKPPTPVSRRESKTTLERMLKSTTARQIGRTVAREVTRGLLGMLGVRRR
jgi:DNA helicase HerA-like ATPase